VFCWITHNQAIGQNVFRDHGTCRDHGTTTYRNAWQDDGTGSDRGTVINCRGQESIRIDLTAWILIIRKRRVRTNENIIADSQAIPELNARFDGDPVTDNHISLNQNMGTDVAFDTNFCTW